MAQTTQKIEIGYARDHRSGNFIVTTLDSSYHPQSKYRRQQIAVLPGVFFRTIPELDRRTIANVIDVTLSQAAELGFLISEAAAYEHAVTA